MEDPAIEIEIPYSRTVLDNGLTLIVHEDRKAPIVAVNLWYHVGSKDEKPGRTGLAHLFEHLMFNGSEHFNDDYFQMTERLGATDLNGTTGYDRTNYFQNVPTTALDAILWLESDRMGHLLGAIDQAKLDEQRGVVQNEIRQGWNQPYGLVAKTIAESSYPVGHPYSRTVGGSIEDLDTTTLEHVREWFRTYYGAANAVIVLAGDIDQETARQKVELYFGDIPPGPPVVKMQSWIAQPAGAKREILQDRVPQSRLYKVWNTPPWGSPDGDYLHIVAEVLSRGRTSRFYKRLVHDEERATTVAAAAQLREIGGQFSILGEARPGVAITDLERSLDEELERLRIEGPTAEELERVKTQIGARFIRGSERIGGFGGKSDILAMSEVFMGAPDFYKVTLRRLQEATADDVRRAAQRWLSDDVYVLEVRPFGSFTARSSGVDRTRVPQPGATPVAHFPELRRATLANGLQVILAERHSVPVVNMSLLVDAGSAADLGRPAGVASMALGMMELGTRHRTSLEISDELARLGAVLGSSSTLDTSCVSVSALARDLAPSLEIFTDIIFNPIFPDDELERLRKRRLAAIEQEKSQPSSMALRAFPRLLYGEGHAYGNALTGTGTPASVRQITREDLHRFHHDWFRPARSTLVVVGDTTMENLLPLLEEPFESWPAGEASRKEIGAARQPSNAGVFIMDRGDALHSMVFAVQVAPPKTFPGDIAIEALNTMLGGTFTSRINMNLREDKHWTYGASTVLVEARGERPYLAITSVQADRTAEAMLEILREMRAIRTERPPTEGELAKVKALLTHSLPGKWETMRAVELAIHQMVRFGLAEDYFDVYPEQIRALTVRDLQDAAHTLLRPDQLIWIIVGERAKIEGPVRALELGEVFSLDSDGNPLD
ncbi:MAG: pitrilysin family protein [Planctomycetota bacterium]